MAPRNYERVKKIVKCADCGEEMLVIQALRCKACKKKRAKAYAVKYYLVNSSSTKEEKRKSEEDSRGCRDKVKKTLWHPYQLSQLTGCRFIRVCNKVIEQKLELRSLKSELSSNADNPT